MMQLLFTAYLLLTFTLKHRPYPQLNPERSPVLYLSARDDMKKYIAACKEEEKRNSPSNETIPISRPNMNVPPVLPPKQYNLPTSNPGKPLAQANLTRTNHDDPEGVTADVLDSSESESDPEITDEDRRVMHALQSLYSVRHINMARIGNSVW